jgi:hypothetical protein
MAAARVARKAGTLTDDSFSTVFAEIYEKKETYKSSNLILF